MTPNAIHTIVVRVIADLLHAIAMNATGCFQIQELRAVSEHLRIVAARNLPDTEYNAKIRLLLAGLIDVARSTDLVAAGKCPVMPKLNTALDVLLALSRSG